MSKWLLSGLITVACVLGVYLLATGLPDKEEHAAEEAPFTVPEVAVDAAAAEQIYQSMCIACHGDQLQGGAGPELAHIGSALTKEELFKTIRDGRRGMPSFEGRLSEDELVTVTTWLASHP